MTEPEGLFRGYRQHYCIRCCRTTTQSYWQRDGGRVVLWRCLSCSQDVVDMVPHVAETPR